jgi:hypothetical protein
MPAIFTTKIVHRQITLSPFSAQQMSDIGSVVLNSSIIPRIRRAETVADAPAPPLVARYAKRKIARGRAPIRDWYWRGLTLGSLKVKSASEDRVTIGPVNGQAQTILAAQNRRARQWGVSPKDYEALNAAVRATLSQHKFVRLVKIA